MAKVEGGGDEGGEGGECVGGRGGEVAGAEEAGGFEDAIDEESLRGTSKRRK